MLLEGVLDLGNLSKETWAKIYDTYANIADTSIDAFGKLATTVGKEGLWLALEIDLLLITGEVKKTETVQWKQREHIASLFKKDGFLDLMQKNIEISVPFGNLPKLPNPLKPFVGLLLAYRDPINKKITVEDKDGQSVEAYAAMEPLDRAFIALVLPSTTRIFMKFLADVLEVG
jgi:hypothetical protein